MFDWKLSSWFYPKQTGDPGRDRNARTVQFACFLLAFAVSTVALPVEIGTWLPTWSVAGWLLRTTSDGLDNTFTPVTLCKAVRTMAGWAS